MKRWGWVFLGAIAALGGTPVHAQADWPSPNYPSRPSSPEATPRRGGLDPLVILNFQLLRSTGGNSQRVDLTPELVEVRSRLSRLYSRFG
jgi:hypothetical protein